MGGDARAQRRAQDVRGGDVRLRSCFCYSFVLGVWGLGFGVWGLGFGVWGLGFGVWGLGFGVRGVGLKVLDARSVRRPAVVVPIYFV